MIIHLNFKVKFRSNGRTIEDNHTFGKGLTAITGPNEKGKSLRLEMIRYGLFGSKALRDVMSSYEELNCSVTFKIRDKTYVVTRSLSQCKLAEVTAKGHKVKVSGTSPVNTALNKLFGYDLEVFDVANACLQGEIESMSKKLPSQRKAMVDRTIGLDVIDDVIKEATTAASNYTKQVEALSRTVDLSLFKPPKPTGYVAADKWQESLDLLWSRKTKDVSLRNELKALEAPRPADITIPNDNLDELYKLQAEANATHERMKHINFELNKLPKGEPDELFSEYIMYLESDAPEKWHEFNEYKALLRAAKKPTYSYDELTMYGEIEEFYTTLRDIQSLKHGEKIECPQCHHKFTTADQHLAELEKSLPEWMKEDTFPDFFHKYQLIRSRFNHAYETHVNQCWADFLTIPQPETPAGEFYGTRELVQLKVNATQALLDARWTRLKLIDEKQELTEKIRNSEGIAQIGQRIIAVKNTQKMIEDYNRKLFLHQQYLDAKARIEPHLDITGWIDADIEKCKQGQSEARQYEHAMQYYDAKVDQNEQTIKVIEEYKEDAAKHKAARQALLDLKPKVKTYLIPSLSKVASQLLSDMTNGVRNKIEISDEFDITVDGDSMESLSGSGKAVANLAVRFALGTVLTNKVFSVLLVDEIDASMDKDRAEYTAQCLRNLTKVFGQIILVSHKEPEADHQIKL